MKSWGQGAVFEEVGGEGARAQMKGHTHLSEARHPQEKGIATWKKFGRQNRGASTSLTVQGQDEGILTTEQEWEEGVSWEAKKTRKGLRHDVGMNKPEESTINE